MLFRSHIIVYLWKGTFKNAITSSNSNEVIDNTDKAVMNKVSASGNGVRIASCDYEFATTNNWEEKVIPLTYHTDDVPEMMNVILSSGDYWERNNVKDGSILEADDVQFVYYSELASLKYDGKEYYQSGKTSYAIDEVYDAVKLKVTSNGKGAKVETSYDSSSSLLTVTIKGDDYDVNKSNYHVYTVQFRQEVLSYGSELASLMYNGKDYFKQGWNSYVIDEYYDESKLYVVANDEKAVVEKAFDEETCVLTITIKGGDYASNPANKHLYRVIFNFTAGVVCPELSSLKYDGVEYLEAGTTSYTIDKVYDAGKLVAMTSNEGATVETDYDASAAVLTITVKGSDFAVNDTNKRVYTVNFKKQTTPVAGSELSSLVYDGTEYFESGRMSYVINEEYDASKLKLASNGAGASIEKKYDENTYVLTITVKGSDFATNGSNKHVYTVQFDKPGPKPLGERLTSLANANAYKTYILYNESYTAYAVYEDGRNDNLWVAGMKSENEGHEVKNPDYSKPVDVTSLNSSWMVIKSGDKYRLYNMGARKFVTTPNYVGGGDTHVYCSFVSQPVDLSVVELGDGKFAFNAVPQNEYSYMCAAPQLDAPVSVWDAADAGSAWILMENPNVAADMGVLYAPAFTGTKTVESGTPQDKRWIERITLISEEYAGFDVNVLDVDNSGRLCYNDYSGTVTMYAAPGEEVELDVSISEDGGWIHSYAYIDSDANGFDASIASDGYTPMGDLVSYSFYNNGGSSDEQGCNSSNASISGNDRNTLLLPSFTVPEVPGTYRLRVKIDWCNIDPMGDRDGEFGDFMNNGGQIVDLMLRVVDLALSDIEDVETEEVYEDNLSGNRVVEGIYDMQGRRIDEITKPGIYIINGKKVYVK